MKERNYSVDIVKLVAALGVIVIHMAPSTRSCGVFTEIFHLFAVPYFLLISLYFFIAKVGRQSTLDVAALRLDRILVPYLAWTVIYPCLQLAKYWLSGRSMTFDPVGVILYGGGAVHLYFLPLLLLLQALALAVILALRNPRCRLVAAGVAFGAIAFGCGGTAGGYLGFDNALLKSAVYVSLVFLLRHAQATTSGRRLNTILGTLIAALNVPAAFYGQFGSVVGLLAGPIFGYGVAALALNWRVATASPLLRTLLTCSYGIYLAHFGFLEAFESLAAKSGHMLAPYTIATKILLAAVIGLCCLLFVALARLHWLSAYLLLGENRDAGRTRQAPSSTQALAEYNVTEEIL